MANGSSDEDYRWYIGGLHFRCFQCGSCCGGLPGYVWVSKEEILSISSYLGVSPVEFERLYLRRVGSRYSLKEKINYDCVFLERDGSLGRCKIYPVRPQQCRTWPFWHCNLRDPDSWAEAGSRCPGINRGRLYSAEEIEGIRNSSPC